MPGGSRGEGLARGGYSPRALGIRRLRQRARTVLGFALCLAFVPAIVAPSSLALADHVSVCEHDDTHPIELIQPIELCRQVVLVGSQTGYVRVTAPEGFALWAEIGPDGSVDFEGEGTVGFLLTKDPPGATGTYAFGLKYPPELAGSSPHALFGCGDLCELPSGNYRLYLLASGSPARVRLNFVGELRGAIELPMMQFPDSRMKLGSPRLPTRPINYAGETGELVSSGLILSAIAVSSPSETAVLGDCLYSGDPGDPAIAYLPGCPSPFAAVAYQDLAVDTPFRPLGQRLDRAWRVPAGTYGVGTWYAAPSTDTTAASLLIWLNFD